MIVVDSELARREAEGRPVQVAIVGAGYMGAGIARQLLRPLPGMRLAGIYNRNADRAIDALSKSGASPIIAESVPELEAGIAAGRPVVASHWSLLCEAGNIDVVLEATGAVEFGADLTLAAIAGEKHVVLMNAELDATVGPILKVLADKADVVITNCDGDEPGVAMNLVRFARGVGYRPVATGNIKGMLDRYRTPATQQGFAEKYDQNVHLVTSAADGTKLSMEAAVLANSAGFGVAVPGMLGPELGHVSELPALFASGKIAGDGIVDYTVGAAPHTGAWVVAYNDDPADLAYMNYFKMGDGPYYCFYTPYHLPHLQVLTTIARAVLFGDATTCPVGGPLTEVATVAKRDLPAGTVLDGIGGFDCYGLIENVDPNRNTRALPMGLSAGCTLLRDMRKDDRIAAADVTMRAPQQVDTLWARQETYFFGTG